MCFRQFWILLLPKVSERRQELELFDDLDSRIKYENDGNRCVVILGQIFHYEVGKMQTRGSR